MNYDLEIRVNGKPTKQFYFKERTYVEGRKGSEYSLYFRNNTSRRVLAVVSVDGLSVMDGKTASEASGGYVVGAWSSVEIPGWRLDNSKVAAFQFRPQSESEPATYVEQLKGAGFNVDTGNQGVIGVMVFPEKVYSNPIWITNTWATYKTPTYFDGSTATLGATAFPSQSYNATARGFTGGELHAKASLSADATASIGSAVGSTSDWYEAPVEKVGTGFGRDINSNAVSVSFARESMTPAFVKVITYDTIQGLRRRGVPVDEADRNPVAAAFPGYNPNGCYDPRR